MPEAAMHVGAEVQLHGGRKAYLAEDATWLQTETFCGDRSSRLCRYEELCPEITSQVSDKVQFSLAECTTMLPLNAECRTKRNDGLLYLDLHTTGWRLETVA
jgi:hypothetical protein